MADLTPEAPAATAFAPGRVELLGNYCDLAGGSVLAAAIELGVLTGEEYDASVKPEEMIAPK